MRCHLTLRNEVLQVSLDCSSVQTDWTVSVYRRCLCTQTNMKDLYAGTWTLNGPQRTITCAANHCFPGLQLGLNAQLM